MESSTVPATTSYQEHFYDHPTCPQHNPGSSKIYAALSTIDPEQNPYIDTQKSESDTKNFTHCKICNEKDAKQSAFFGGCFIAILIVTLCMIFLLSGAVLGLYFS